MGLMMGCIGWKSIVGDATVDAVFGGSNGRLGTWHGILMNGYLRFYLFLR